MVLVVLVAALAVTAVLLTGGGEGLAELRLRAVRLLVAAAGIQVATSALAPGSTVLRGTALLLTTVLVGLFLYGNRTVTGLPLVGVGVLLNVVVVAANGAMPVDVDAARRAGLTGPATGLGSDAPREPLDDATVFPLLADVLPVVLPRFSQVVSVGDVLVAAGVGLLLVSAGRSQGPRRASRATVLDSDSTTTGSYS